MLRLHIYIINTKISCEINNASDAEFPDPGNSVAVATARQGIADDDTASNIGNDLMVLIKMPLHEEGSICPICSRSRINLMFLRPQKLNEHFSNHHLDKGISWCCRNCNKAFNKLQGWFCHHSKCKGLEAVNTATKEFKCEVCTSSFDTKRGLSTHERLMHPNLRNTKRQATNMPLNTVRIDGRSRRAVWTQEEVELLKQLEIRFSNCRYLNKEIAKFITNKTNKQISDKRREIRLLNSHEPTPDDILDLNQNENNNNEINNDDRNINNSSDNDINSDENNDGFNNMDNIVDDNNMYSNENNNVNLSIESIPAIVPSDEREWLTALEINIENISNIPEKVKNIYSELKDLWEKNKNNTEILSTELNRFIESSLTQFLIKTVEDSSDKQNINNIRKNKNNDNRQQKNNKHKKTTRNHIKKYNYARCQELYKSCPKKLVDMVINNDQSFINPPKSPPAADEVKRLYSNIWEDTNIVSLPEIDTVPSVSLTRFFPPIMVDEVKKRMSKINNKSAAGIDKIEKFHLQTPGIPELLTMLYNIICFTNYYPETWKKNRTTLIPKPGLELDKIENWRPITISSLMSRIFTSLIDLRIRDAVQQNIRQKGFTSENGCKQNIMLLSAALSNCKRNNGGTFAILDISKAFDTIPHSIISNSLKRKGIPDKIVRMIEKMYENCTTEIKAKNNEIVKINIKKGVKQGDPLSPLLFNIAIEELLNRLENSSE